MEHFHGFLSGVAGKDGSHVGDPGEFDDYERQ